MEFNAYKMDGLGNDFIIIDQRDRNTILSNDQIIKICDRKFLGCDQLIYIKKDNDLDAELEFYNSDGSKSDACGNGTRCVAHLLSKENNKKEINLKVASKTLKSKIFENNLVETSIGLPRMNWNEIPLSKETDTKNLKIKLVDKENKEFYGGIAVNVGNPHVIFFIENIEKFNIEKIGPEIENHELFPEKCNVTLAKKISPSLIKVKVWERGAGLTKACGTAACATAVAANLENLSNSKTEIEFGMGKLLVSIDENHNIKMMGPVSEIKEIKINI
jgi:diaminopimelate epimerase